MKARKLSDKVPVKATQVYDSETFREVLMKHLPQLKMGQVGTLDVSQNEADKYKGDFHGLLLTKQVQSHLWWLFTVLNGLTCSTDYDGTMLEIITPDIDYLEKLVSIHLTAYV